MSFKFPLTPLALAVTLGVGQMILTAPAQAAGTETQQQVQLNIAAGPLGRALSSLGSQTGLALSYQPELVAGIEVAGLTGSYQSDIALQTLLAGTGIKAVKRGPGAYALIPQANAATEQLDKIVVKGGKLSVTEGSNSYTTGAMDTATGLALSIRDTPQSVTVISRQQLDDQNIVSLREAVLSTPGLSAVQGDFSGDSAAYMSRGFALNKIMMDGLSVGITGSGSYNGVTDDMAFYDRVEVIRGANGLMQGAGTPSASINLVRKRPTATPQTDLTVSAGSWDYYRLEADTGGALNDSATLRGRMVAAYEDKDSFVDILGSNTRLFYGALEADLSDRTTLFVAGSWRDFDGDGINNGMPDAADGSLIGSSRSTYFGHANEYERTTNKGLFAELKHDLGSGWNMRIAAQMQNMDADFVESYKWYSSTDELRLGAAGYDYDHKRQAADARITGQYTLFDRSHDLLVGLNGSRQKTGGSGGWEPGSWSDTGGVVVDPFDWNPRQYANRPIDDSLWNYGFETRETGFYAITRINTSDDLAILAGGRVSNYSYKYSDGGGYKKNGVTTPYLGTTWAFDDNHSAYASYTEIFEVQSNEDKNGDLLPPLTGKNYEVGVKGEYLNGQLNVSAALFRMLQKNRAVNDYSTQNPCTPDSRGWCQKASGEVESNGLELELSGEPMPGWNLSAGYSYVLAEYNKDDDASLIGKTFDTSMPEHQFKLATNYQLTGDLAAWNLGGSVRYQSEIKRGGYGGYYEDSVPSQEAYTLVNLNAGYRISPNWKVNMNVENLFDKEYFSGLGWGSGGRTYGEPRSFTATVRGEF